MDNDFSEILNKFSDILKEKDIDLNSITGGNTTPPVNSNNSDNFSNSNNSNDFNLDINTILKIKDILAKINKNTSSPRNKLLQSLEPYLEKEKQEKLHYYIKIANLLSIVEELDLGINFLEKNKQDYDLILIITLFLLIF